MSSFLKGFHLTKKTCKLSKELYFTHIVIHALDSHHHWSRQLRLKQASFFLTPPRAARKKVREEERPHRNSWRAGGGGHIALSCPALNLPSLSNGFQSSVQFCTPQYQSNIIRFPMIWAYFWVSWIPSKSNNYTTTTFTTQEKKYWWRHPKNHL